MSRFYEICSFALCAFLLASLAVASPAEGGEKSKFNRQLDIGDAAPVFENLPGVDGESHSFSDYDDAQVLVAIFTCNHCPVAKAYESRIKSAVDDFAENGVKFVGISCSLFPADSFEKMKTRAKERSFNFDYLFDESQDTGEAYGAAVTPHVFVLDKNRRIAYMGAIDDNLQSDEVKYHYLRDAIEALLANRPIEVAETKPKGCPIEYEE